MNLAGLIFVLIGLYCVIAAALDWNMLLNHRKAQIFVWLFGRNGARIFYVVLGSIIGIVGTLVFVGVIQMPPQRV
jgi:hypothetical protein